MEEQSLYDDVVADLDVLDEATARDIIRIVRSVLVEHDREISREVARRRIYRDAPFAR